MKGNEENSVGKLSLDMLIGLSIFLFAFIFIAQFLPSVFADARSDISVFSEAYKVSVLLTEDPGRWINRANPSEKGFHWETEWYKDNISFRPGLAVVGKAGFINLNKLMEFKNVTITYCLSYDNDSWIRDVFGLTTPSNSYHVNISMLIPFSTSYRQYFSVNDSGVEIFAIGPPIPDRKVSRYERLVNLPKINDFYDRYSFTSPNPMNENITQTTLTFPIGGAIIYISNITQCTTTYWIKINVTLTNTTSGNTSTTEVFKLENDNCDPANVSAVTGYHSITRELNEGYCELYTNFTETYQESPDQTNVTLRIKNLNGFVELSRVGEIVGDRIVVKLVVTVWEGG